MPTLTTDLQWDRAVRSSTMALSGGMGRHTGAADVSGRYIDILKYLELEWLIMSEGGSQAYCTPLEHELGLRFVAREILARPWT